MLHSSFPHHSIPSIHSMDVIERNIPLRYILDVLFGICYDKWYYSIFIIHYLRTLLFDTFSSDIYSITFDPDVILTDIRYILMLFIAYSMTLFIPILLTREPHSLTFGILVDRLLLLFDTIPIYCCYLFDLDYSIFPHSILIPVIYIISFWYSFISWKCWYFDYYIHFCLLHSVLMEVFISRSGVHSFTIHSFIRCS